MYIAAAVKSARFTARTTREERGASFTEYVVLVAVVVALIIGIGFSGIGEALTDKIGDIATNITNSDAAPAPTPSTP